MNFSTPISYWNRGKNCIESETISRDRFLHWSFESLIGNILLKVFFSKRFFSKIYGLLANRARSRNDISPFIQRFHISMSEYEETNYKTFNEFFIRKFKPGLRTFCEASNELPAFAEGKYLGYESLSKNQKFPVKGMKLSAAELLKNAELAKPFENGPVLICRITPADYHRFHFPDCGTTVESFPLHGPLNSTNPIAYRYKPDIFVTNERRVSLLKTKNFGFLAYIEVGAMCVGQITQSHPTPSNFKRGDEKGYFLIGGSTVILLGEPGKWQPTSDILEQTKFNRETKIRLGEPVGIFKSPHEALEV